jgi:hypothetical protein
MVPLPANPYKGDQIVWREAYKVCLALELRAHHSPITTPQYSLLIYERLLGYMIVEAPIPLGRTFIATKINSCSSDESLLQLAEFLLYYSIRPRLSLPSGI